MVRRSIFQKFSVVTRNTWKVQQFNREPKPPIRNYHFFEVGLNSVWLVGEGGRRGREKYTSPLPLLAFQELMFYHTLSIVFAFNIWFFNQFLDVNLKMASLPMVISNIVSVISQNIYFKLFPCRRRIMDTHCTSLDFRSDLVWNSDHVMILQCAQIKLLGSGMLFEVRETTQT